MVCGLVVLPRTPPQLMPYACLDGRHFDHGALTIITCLVGFVELGQNLTNAVDIGARFAEEKSIVRSSTCAAPFLARHLGRDEDRHVFRSGVTKLEAVALGRLGGAFGAGFDVVGRSRYYRGRGPWL